MQFVEVGLAPPLEQVALALQHFLDQRVGLAIEAPIEQLGGIDEELVHGDAQPVGQTMEGARVRFVAAGGDATDGPLIDTGLFGHLVEGEFGVGHQPQQVGSGVLGHVPMYIAGAAGRQGGARKKPATRLSGVGVSRASTAGVYLTPRAVSLPGGRRRGSRTKRPGY